jgi:hypothetical protein
LDLTKTHAQDVEWWEQNFQSQPNDPSSVTTTKPFRIPKRNLNALPHASNMKGTLPINDGIRDVDVVTHRELIQQCKILRLKFRIAALVEMLHIFNKQRTENF